MATTYELPAVAEPGRGRTSSVLVGLGGAALGGSLTWVAVTLVPWFEDGALGRLPIGPTAIVVGSILGLAAGWGAVATDRPARFVLLQATRAVVVVTTAWALGVFLEGRAAGTEELRILASYALVLPFALLFGLPLAVPVAAMSTGLLRIAARLPALGAILMVVVVGTGCAVAVARPPVAQAIGQLVTDAGPTPNELRWTVVNRSTSDLVLGVWTREPDGYGGSLMGVPACRITTGADEVGESWFVSLDREEPIDTEPVPVVEVTDASGPGTVWLEVAANGTTTGVVGREPPGIDATLEDACDPVTTP